MLRGFEPVCLFQGRPEWRRLQVRILGDTSREIHLTAVLLESHSCALKSIASGETQALEGYPIDVGWYGRTTGRSGRALRPERALPLVRGWSRLVAGLATRHELQIQCQKDPPPQTEVQRILRDCGYYPRRWQEWDRLLGPEMALTERNRVHARSLTDGDQVSLA